MIRATIGDALNNHYTLQEACGVYIVRDGSTVLYVGKTKNRPITARMEWHMGHGFSDQPSTLGKLIKQHAPRSHRWQLEVHELADCNALLEQHGEKRRRKIDTAEIALIHLLKPALNKQSNPEPGPLPEKYR